MFTGILEDKNESANDYKTKLRFALSGIENVDGSKLKIGRCHRLGKPYPGKTRPIIAHLPDFEECELIFTGKNQLTKGLYINTDMPVEISQRRRELLPIFKSAKSLPKFRDNTKLIGDKLWVNGVQYQCRPNGNLLSLPPELIPAMAAK